MRNRGWSWACAGMAVLWAWGGALEAQEGEPTIEARPLSEWVKQLRSQNRGEQVRASQSLGKAPPELRAAIAPRLIPVLKSDRENDKFVAAQVLGEYGPASREAVPELLAMLKGTQFERNRAAAAKALGQILKDAESSAQVDQATAALIGIFGDKYSDVRREAVRACGMIGPAARACVPHLAARLEDNFEPWKESGEALMMIRQAAAWTAGRMGKDSLPLIDRLLAQLHQYQPDCSWEWVYAIGEIGLAHEQVMPNLVRRLEKTVYGQWIMAHGENYPGYVQRLLGVLEKFGPRSAPAVELLMAVLEEKGEPWMVAGVVKVLGAIGPAAEKSIPVLERKGLGSKNEEVRKAATEALRKIRPGKE